MGMKKVLQSEIALEKFTNFHEKYKIFHFPEISRFFLPNKFPVFSNRFEEKKFFGKNHYFVPCLSICRKVHSEHIFFTFF